MQAILLVPTFPFLSRCHLHLVTSASNQCFKYRIYRSAKLYTGYWISGDISRYDIKYWTSYRMKNIHVIAYINHMKLLK